jgi:hypothetical protein
MRRLAQIADTYVVRKNVSAKAIHNVTPAMPGSASVGINGWKAGRVPWAAWELALVRRASFRQAGKRTSEEATRTLASVAVAVAVAHRDPPLRTSMQQVPLRTLMLVVDCWESGGERRDNHDIQDGYRADVAITSEGGGVTPTSIR